MLRATMPGRRQFQESDLQKAISWRHLWAGLQVLRGDPDKRPATRLESSQESGPLSTEQNDLAAILQSVAGMRLVPDAEVRTEQDGEGECLAVVEVKHPTTIGLLLTLDNYLEAWKETVVQALRDFPENAAEESVYGALTQVLSFPIHELVFLGCTCVAHIAPAAADFEPDAS